MGQFFLNPVSNNFPADACIFTRNSLNTTMNRRLLRFLTILLCMTWDLQTQYFCAIIILYRSACGYENVKFSTLRGFRWNAILTYDYERFAFHSAILFHVIFCRKNRWIFDVNNCLFRKQYFAAHFTFFASTVQRN